MVYLNWYDADNDCDNGNNNDDGSANDLKWWKERRNKQIKKSRKICGEVMSLMMNDHVNLTDFYLTFDVALCIGEIQWIF